MLDGASDLPFIVIKNIQQSYFVTVAPIKSLLGNKGIGS
jgi:hypothetical protein